MDEIVKKYREGKFSECLQLLRSLPKFEDINDSLIIRNCSLICSATMNILYGKNENNVEFEKELLNFSKDVLSLGNLVQIDLRLSATFNYFWWLFFYSNKESGSNSTEKYFEIINSALAQVTERNLSFEVCLSTEEKTIKYIKFLKDIFMTFHGTSVFLIVELLVIVVMIVIKFRSELISNCADLIDELYTYIIEHNYSIKYNIKCKNFNCIFKFSLNGFGKDLSDLKISVVYYLKILRSTLFFLIKNYKESLKEVLKNTEFEQVPLISYLAALNSYKLNNNCLTSNILNETLSNSIMCPHLKMRIYILQGKLAFSEKKYKKSLKHFQNSLNISLTSAVSYYYIGKTLGKMGLYDLMTVNFEKCVQVLLSSESQAYSPENDTFEKQILNWIHPCTEIKQSESLYSLAVSLGLSERFNEAAETYEKLLRLPMDPNCKKIPNIITVLHEASTMNLLAGKLERAQEIALQAINRYYPKKFIQHSNEPNLCNVKDISWLRVAINNELTDQKSNLESLKNEIIYSEDCLYFFSDDLIGQLIIAEVQKIQGKENYKLILKKLFSLLSNYLSNKVKGNNFTEHEKLTCNVIKGLACKICLRIALMQVGNKDFCSIEKMYKRALLCNKGDIETLLHFCKFLITNGKKREASKLWHTFYNEENLISPDHAQSLSLRYFLRSYTSMRDLEKIQRELE